MKKIDLSQAFACASTEFIKWICDARMIILCVLLVFIFSFSIEPLLNNADKMIGADPKVRVCAVFCYNSLKPACAAVDKKTRRQFRFHFC